MLDIQGYVFLGSLHNVFMDLKKKKIFLINYI